MRGRPVKTFTAIIEQDLESGGYVGYVPGLAGAHTQGDTLDELNANLKDVLSMLAEDGELELDSKFVGTQIIALG